MIIALRDDVNGFAQAYGEVLDFDFGFRTLIVVYNPKTIVILKEEGNGNGKVNG